MGRYMFRLTLFWGLSAAALVASIGGVPVSRTQGSQTQHAGIQASYVLRVPGLATDAVHPAPKTVSGSGEELLVFPEGGHVGFTPLSLSHPGQVTVQIRELNNEERASLTWPALSRAYEFDLHGATVVDPVNLSLPFESGVDATPRLARFDAENNAWEPIPTQVDFATALAAGTVSQFSTYAVLNVGDTTSTMVSQILNLDLLGLQKTIADAAKGCRTESPVTPARAAVSNSTANHLVRTCLVAETQTAVTLRHYNPRPYPVAFSLSSGRTFVAGASYTEETVSIAPSRTLTIDASSREDETALFLLLDTVLAAIGEDVDNATLSLLMALVWDSDLLTDPLIADFIGNIRGGGTDAALASLQAILSEDRVLGRIEGVIGPFLAERGIRVALKLSARQLAPVLTVFSAGSSAYNLVDFVVRESMSLSRGTSLVTTQASAPFGGPVQAGPALCSPSSLLVSQEATCTASRAVSWSAPGHTTSIGVTFKVKWSTPGSYIVTACSSDGYYCVAQTLVVSSLLLPPILTGPPNPPSNVSAKLVSWNAATCTATVDVSWKDNSSNETGFLIGPPSSAQTRFQGYARVATNVTSARITYKINTGPFFPVFVWSVIQTVDGLVYSSGEPSGAFLPLNPPANCTGPTGPG